MLISINSKNYIMQLLLHYKIPNYYVDDSENEFENSKQDPATECNFLLTIYSLRLKHQV